MSNKTPAPKVISDDDVKQEYPILDTEVFDYDFELYDEELREHEDEEVLIVDSLPTYLDEDFPPDGPVVPGAPVPVIYDDSVIRTARYVNGQFQYAVRFTVSNVPNAIDYEVRVTDAS